MMAKNDTTETPAPVAPSPDTTAAHGILTEIENEIRSFAKLPAEFELWLKAKIAKAKNHLSP